MFTSGARFTLIVIVTLEEERALETIQQVCEKRDRQAVSWDYADGFHNVRNWKGALNPAATPIDALKFIESTNGNPVFVLKDFHECWENAKVKRKLRNVAQRLKFTRKSLIVLSPTSEIPPELRDDAVLLDFPLPDATEIEQVMQRLIALPRRTCKPLPRRTRKDCPGSARPAGVSSRACVWHGHRPRRCAGRQRYRRCYDGEAADHPREWGPGVLPSEWKRRERGEASTC